MTTPHLSPLQQVSLVVLRTLVGSIGLVAAIPITTAVAAFVASKEKPHQSANRITGDLHTGYDPAKGPWIRTTARGTR